MHKFNCCEVSIFKKFNFCHTHTPRCVFLNLSTLNSVLKEFHFWSQKPLCDLIVSMDGRPNHKKSFIFLHSVDVATGRERDSVVDCMERLHPKGRHFRIWSDCIIELEHRHKLRQLSPLPFNSLFDYNPQYHTVSKEPWQKVGETCHEDILTSAFWNKQKNETVN